MKETLLFFLDISHNPYEGGVGVVIIETWGGVRYQGKIITHMRVGVAGDIKEN